MDPNGDKKKWRYALWDLDATFDHYVNYTGVPDTSSDAAPCDPEELGDPGGQGHVPILNALLSTSGGTSWTSVHHGGGVGMGLSIHSGVVIVADGSDEMKERINRVLTNDPGLCVARHADAGYERAIEISKERNLKIPMHK